MSIELFGEPEEDDEGITEEAANLEHKWNEKDQELVHPDEFYSIDAQLGNLLLEPQLDFRRNRLFLLRVVNQTVFLKTLIDSGNKRNLEERTLVVPWEEGVELVVGKVDRNFRNGLSDERVAGKEEDNDNANLGAVDIFLPEQVALHVLQGQEPGDEKDVCKSYQDQPPNLHPRASCWE